VLRERSKAGAISLDLQFSIFIAKITPRASALRRAYIFPMQRIRLALVDKCSRVDRDPVAHFRRPEVIQLACQYTEAYCNSLG
jgi:hypothetical protein